LVLNQIKVMGARISSLQEIEDGFESWLINNIPADPVSSNIYQNTFELKTVYHGEIDENFAKTMKGLIVNYLTNNDRPNEKIVGLCIVVIIELIFNNVNAMAADLFEALLPFGFIINDWKYRDGVIGLIKERAISYINSLDAILLLYNREYNREYNKECNQLFDDKLIKQFKMLYCHHKEVSPFNFILKSKLGADNSQCLLWLIETFHYSNQQLQQIFAKTGMCHASVRDAIVSKAGLTHLNFLDIYWSNRSKWLIDCGYLTRDVLIESADTVDKKNIITMDFYLVSTQ
jgi:hypothetical protein